MLDTESVYSVLSQQPTRDPWFAMDWTLGTDQSLQDMLDCDIKSEIDSVIGGHPELGFNFTELSPLQLDDDPENCQNDLNGWFGSQTLINGNSDNSNSHFNLDLSGCDAASIMVNPNSVMPHMVLRSPTPSNTTSTSAKRNFSFLLKNEIKEDKLEPIELSNSIISEMTIPKLKKYEIEEHESGNEQEFNDVTDSENESDDEEISFSNATNAHQLNLSFNKPKTTLILPAHYVKTISPQSLKTHQQQELKVNSTTSLRLQNLKIFQNNGQVQQLRRQVFNNSLHTQVLTQQQQDFQNLPTVISPSNQSNPKIEKDFDPLATGYDSKLYPKPAYSYSCLIAMALKNSQTGSLPVSEIYNFMCEHFPYFKTAPNGWKNSVRHNLSLNKCFEKIEKPTGNGNQRKGCLWAINPAKIAKMDEEVQKWSRKDPLAIKKAMIYPDHLELLERGEMKYIVSGDISEDTESSADETEVTEESTQSHQLGHQTANSITDSYDESSQDCDVDINEQVYDDIDIDDNKDSLHMSLNISKQSNIEYQLSPNTKRQKTLTGTLQGNYVYQPVVTARRKAPLFLTTSGTAGSFLKIE